jgi:mRNA interferase MazF
MGSRPAKRRPVVVVQSDALNRTALNTVVVVSLTTNLELAGFPGNVLVPASACGLHRDSVVNVTSVASVGRHELEPPTGMLPPALMRQIDAGLRLVLGL